MKKCYVLILVAILFVLSGCTSKYDKVKKVVEEYNKERVEYTQRIEAYNSSAKSRNDAVQSLSVLINQSKQALDSNEGVLEEETKTKLKQTIQSAEKALVAEVDLLPDFEDLSVNESMTSEELDEIKNKVEQDTKTMQEITVPDPVEPVDYSNILTELNNDFIAYSNSVAGYQRITAPSDDYVISKLQGFDTITGIEAVTEEHDPNMHLNKAGGYIGTIYFRDSRIKADDLYIEPGYTVIDIGTDGGGSIEVYPDVAGAEKRNTYLASFDGTIFDTGSHHVYGTIIIRTSRFFTATQQREFTEAILNALTEAE